MTEVLNQQEVKFINPFAQDLIDSNLREAELETSVERLKRSLKRNQGNSKAISAYTRELNGKEKQDIYELTFRLGNFAFFNKEENGEQFTHSYSLRFIKLNSSDIKSIDNYANSSVIA